MERVNVADFDSRLSDLVDRAEGGETIDLHRDGKLAARLVPVVPAKKKIDIEALRELWKTQPLQQVSAGAFVREMRDSSPY